MSDIIRIVSEELWLQEIASYSNRSLRSRITVLKLHYVHCILCYLNYIVS